jgi:type 1 glutamine amidotransferase
LKPYPLSEEFYYNMRFRENDPRLAPILTVRLPGEPRTQTIAWAVERKDGGRGFAFTGGHDHGNWRLDGYRKMILNGILWTARGNVPAEGAGSAMPPDAIREPANRIRNESGMGSD